MAVLKKHPITVLLAGMNKFLSLRTLTLTERDNLQALSIVALLRKLDKRTGGVGTCAQYKDKWSLHISIYIDHIHGCRWGLYEESANLFKGQQALPFLEICQKFVALFVLVFTLH
jgi:hypothetical protein